MRTSAARELFGKKQSGAQKTTVGRVPFPNGMIENTRNNSKTAFTTKYIKYHSEYMLENTRNYM